MYTIGNSNDSGPELRILEMNYKKISGGRIREGRIARDLSQEALADLVGVEPSTIGNYEQGTRYPKPNVMSKLAKVLHLPVGYISGLETDKRIEALVLLYSKMGKRDKDMLFRIAEAQSAEQEPEDTGT